METFAVFVAGVIVGMLSLYALRRKPSAVPQAVPEAIARAPVAHETTDSDTAVAADESSASPAAGAPLTPSARLQQLTEQLDAVGEASAHPRDLADVPVFREAVELLESTDLPVDAVADYATGANWMLSAAAFAALRTRTDRASAAMPTLARVRYLRPWPLFYALRYFEALDVPPPVGALVLQGGEWWAEHPFMSALFAEHLTTLTARGDVPGFGNALVHATAPQLASAEEFLRNVDHPAARILLEGLVRHRRGRIDRGFLQTFGQFAEGDDSDLLVEHEAIGDLLAHAESSLLSIPPRSLLAVGEPRSGKTSFLSLLARRAAATGWTMFEAGGADLQAGQKHVGELEERLRQFIVEVAVDKRVLWHAPDFLQLATSGTHQGQSASLLDQVLPAIAAGRIVLLSEITPAALTRVLQFRPAVRTAMELIRLRSLTEAETARLAGDVASRLATHFRVSIAPDVRDTTTYLARHYLGTSQSPGSVLDLLKQAVQRAVAHDATRVQRSDVLATMAQLSGMPQQVLDDRERVDLAALRAFFSARVIGQDEAVDAIVDRIAMLKAGLTDAGRPVAVFLFAGPTGTGKTELAKTLAEFLFGSAERLIRLDMSEFQTPDAMRKIVGEPEGQGENALTDRVRKQPFSVVLLDEFEKAHAVVWDVFLQVFDDGRLSDGGGVTVDFRHCIIILTSNLGSTIKQDAGPGFVAHAAVLSSQHVMKAINQSFRPEFVNRIDRIIVFRPLGRDQMRSIVAKELSLVLQRRGLRHREWAVEWEASALEFLLDKGFSPAMGARPLKRAIDQHLLAPLAATVVEHRVPEGDQFLFVRSDGKALQVEFVDPDAPDSGAGRVEMDASDAPDSGLTLARMMLQPTGAPAEQVALAAALQQIEGRLSDTAWLAVESDLASRMQRPDFWDVPDRRAILSRFEVIDRVRAALVTARSLAARLDRSAGVSGRFSRELVARLAAHLFVLAHGIDDAIGDAPVEVVLAIEPVLDRTSNTDVSVRWCHRLTEMYRKWSARRGMQLSEVTGAGTRGLLVISGFGAARLLAGETGLHVLDYEERGDEGRTIARVTVMPTPAVLPESVPDQYATLSQELDRGSRSSVVIRRYRVGSSPMIRDVRRGWRTGRVEIVFDGNFDLIGDVWPVASDT